jgi:hypothetical protein
MNIYQYSEKEHKMYKSLLTKINESDLPSSPNYNLNYLDDEGLDYLKKVYEENKSVSYETWEELKDNVYISMLQGGYPFKLKDEIFEIVDEWIKEDYEDDC